MGRISLRLRVTLVCGMVLMACCVLLTLGHNYYAGEMVNAIQAIPLQPARAVGESAQGGTVPMEQITQPARAVFRNQSLMAMLVIVAAGCAMVYWLTGKALAPLHRLDQQIRRRTAADLDSPLPVPGSGDEVAGLAVSFNEMSRNLSQAFAQQKRFSQCAAHELRTPLTILKTRMALFRKKGLCSTPEMAQLLAVLEEQTDRLSDLVSDLLALTNMDGVDCGERVELAPLLAGVLENLQGEARPRGIQMQLNSQAGAVRGNPLLLERAFFNLVENAIHYNRPGGSVLVAVEERGDCLLVWVEDEGSGIPPQLKQQIFEPFFRVDKSRSRQLGGAGLGLSLVRAIVQLHQGEVWQEPAAVQGSRFVVKLPRTDQGSD